MKTAAILKWPGQGLVFLLLLLLLFLQAGIGAAAEETEAKVPEGAAVAAPRPLTWHKSLAPALEESRRRSTSILVKVGADWCGWCKRLDKEMESPDVQKELSGWTLVRLDADADAEEVRQLRIGPIPALRVLNASGRRVRSHDGYLTADDFLRWLRGEDARPGDVPRDEAAPLPDLEKSSVDELVRLLAHRNANVREAVVRRLAQEKSKASSQVTVAFVKGKLAARLAALELLTEWNAPVESLDPWQPGTLTARRLDQLEEWAARVSSDSNEPAPSDNSQIQKALTEEQLADVRADLVRMLTADRPSLEAIGARLARFGVRIIPLIQNARSRVDSDQDRERLDWLRFRIVASDALVLKWSGGLFQLASTDARARHQAAGELPDVTSKGDESLLIELFGHSDSFVRELSLKALHNVGGQRAAQELSRLLSDPEPNVRAAVLKQMADHPLRSLTPQIVNYIAQEKDPDLIVHAVRLLRKFKTKDALACLLTQFEHSSWQVRAEAIDAVHECLSNVPGETSDDEGLVPAKQVIRPEDIADAYNAILRLLKDSDGFVVSRAVAAMKSSDLAIAVVPIAKAAESHPELARLVTETLRYSSTMSEKAPAILEKWLDHEDERLRAASILALGEMGNLDGKSQLIPALSDPSASVRMAAMRTLLDACDRLRPRMATAARSKGILSVQVSPAAATAPAVATSPAPAAPAAAPAAPGDARPDQPAPPRPAPSLTSPRPFNDEDAKPALSVDEQASTDEADGNTSHPGSPYETWLAGFRSGARRPSWMQAAIAPLQAMLMAPQPKERMMAGFLLIVLGDDACLPQVISIALTEHPSGNPATSILQWLPWEQRLAVFHQISSHFVDPEDRVSLIRDLVTLRDQRATEILWKELAGKDVNASLAHAIYAGLLRVQGIDIHNDYPNKQPVSEPLDFRAEDVKKFALESPGPWVRRVALALLMQFDSESAVVVARSIMSDATLEKTLRIDGLKAMLLSLPEKQANSLSIEVLQEPDGIFAPVGIRYLTTGLSPFRSFADGQFPLSDRAVRNRPNSDRKFPEGLTPDRLQPITSNADEEVAAGAAYLMARAGDYSKLSKVTDYWLKNRESNDIWTKMTYEAIAASDDPQYVPVLQDIFRRLQKSEPYLIRDFYWSVRTMHGSEILKLRKQIRDEVGMDNLR